MPRKRKSSKRLGRPPGSKNKKAKKLENLIKTEGDSDESTQTDNVCTYCSQSFDTKINFNRHRKSCLKRITQEVQTELKVRI